MNFVFVGIVFVHIKTKNSFKLYHPATLPHGSSLMGNFLSMKHNNKQLFSVSLCKSYRPYVFVSHCSFIFVPFSSVCSCFSIFAIYLALQRIIKVLFSRCCKESQPKAFSAVSSSCTDVTIKEKCLKHPLHQCPHVCINLPLYKSETI